jgi:hypothetical protein
MSSFIIKKTPFMFLTRLFPSLLVIIKLVLNLKMLNTTFIALFSLYISFIYIIKAIVLYTSIIIKKKAINLKGNKYIYKL